MSGYILVIDQGTTSSRAMVFDRNQQIVSMSQKPVEQYFPRSGWVEHDPEDIWLGVLAVCRDAIEKAGITTGSVAALGITNQRETVVMWDRLTGRPVHRAIVWQDRRTADLCARLRREGHEPTFTRSTGLLLDPYFSGTKIAWLLENMPGLRERAETGRIAFGTIDSYLIWRLTKGKRHVTDATNASRTLIYDIARNDWNDGLLDILDIPRSVLPEVLDCADDFGVAEAEFLGAEIPVLGVAGDQQAAMLGNACFQPGMLKSTYGTGCFALLNTGDRPVLSRNRLLTTIAYRLGGKTSYALEGSIFMAGASVDWLQQSLGLVKNAAETGELADLADPSQDIYMVPAFVGLGAPYWNPDVRGALFGLTRATGPAEIAKATLESVCYQTHDLLEAMNGDWATSGLSSTILRVDGGMSASDWTMQRLSDLLRVPVDRPANMETTALGAAWLAGSKAGIWPDAATFADGWKADRRFTPRMSGADAQRKKTGWDNAVRATLSTVR